VWEGICPLNLVQERLFQIIIVEISMSHSFIASFPLYAFSSFFRFKDMAADPFLASAGIASDWPCGRGCYQSKDGGFIIWFGEEDQLRIMCMGKGFNLLDVFGRLEKVTI
jgi:hypothetical protein